MKVRHPGVVRIEGVERLRHPDTSQEELALVMEYLRGGDLLHFNGPLSIDHARKCIEDLGDGLQAIHDCGLVHDDIHAGNVFITDDSAKLLDIPHEKTLAGAGASTAVRTRSDDVRDLIRVIREVLEHVPTLDKSHLAECHYQAERESTSAAQISLYFARLWAASSALERAQAVLGSGKEICLVAQHGTAGYRTHIVIYGRAVAEVPVLLVAVDGRLLIMRDPGREIFILRYDLLERWQEEHFEPKDSDYERKVLSAPVLQTLDAVPRFELSSSEPSPGSRDTLFICEREVNVTGIIGGYLFVEQFDYRFAGGAHPNSGRFAYVLHLPSSTRLHSIFSEHELDELRRREMLVARESFIRTREDEAIFEEMSADIEIAAAYPVFDHWGYQADVRVVFTTFTNYAASESRWASYTQAEELTLRRTPERLKDAVQVPEQLRAVIAELPRVIGWSALTKDDAGYTDLAAIIAERISTVSSE
jgi:serine/threonine protein kinase